jgi:hypothetical protein
MKIYQIQYWASKNIQKLRLATLTPQSLGITDIYRAHHLKSSVLFFIRLLLRWKYIRYITQHSNIFRSWDWQLELLNLLGFQTFLARVILLAQFFFHSFVFGMTIYWIHYSASKYILKLRLATGTPQFLGITGFSCAHHLRSSVLFLFFWFWNENKSETLLSIQTYSEAEIGSWDSSIFRDYRLFSRTSS